MIDFGLTPEQFWQLNFASFSAYRKYRLKTIQREDYRSGIIVSAIANVMGGKTEPADFFYSLKIAKKEEKPRIMSAEQIKSYLVTAFGAPGRN